MEKKNNQMVDKEKELKNVAPDTDVAPDVTDASSFQGGPSHTSSNRQQMRLINRIDYYKWKINLLTELISVERENLEKSRDKRTDAYKERQRRKIFPLKLKASDVDEAVEELYGRDIEKFDKRQKLNFREYRQNLRRAEGLLNPDGTLKRFELDAEGNEIPFENVLSAESQELLKAFEVSQAEQRAAFMEGLRVKAVAAVGEGAADAEDIYEAARLEDETALESFVAEENAKIEKRMEKYVDWGVEKGIISRSTADSYLISAYAMSSFIALDVFMTGIDRLADKEITREAFLEAMESAPINVPISGGVNYANGQRIGLDGMSFVKYVRPTEAGAAASTGTFVNVVGMQSIDQILGELDDAE